jgi:hypothetical protein
VAAYGEVSMAAVNRVAIRRSALDDWSRRWLWT